MEILSRQEFEKLANYHGENCVSIYIPTHRSGKEVTNGKDALLFKNQLQRVRHTLTEMGMHENDAREYLQPAYKLHEDSNFWHHQLEGLAVFIGQDHFSYHRIPLPLDEFSTVSKSFHLQQLVPLFNGDGLYYILAVSQEKVRLIEATRFLAHEIDTGDTLQQGIMEVLKYYDFDPKGIKNQSSTQGGGYLGPGGALPGGTKGGGGVNPSGNRGGAVFHGHGDNMQDGDNLILEYFRNIIEGLSHYIKSDNTPIVLAAVDYLHPLFKDAAAKNSGYKIMEKGIVGNPDELHMKELHKKSWESVEGHFNKERRKSREAYHDLAGTGKTSYDLNEIVAASVNGRIESLFLTKGAHTWGTFHPDDQEVEVHDEFKYGDDDLVSKSAVHTILNNGKAYVVESGELPEKAVDTEMVAVMRY
jgi:hypothetical protein